MNADQCSQIYRYKLQAHLKPQTVLPNLQDNTLDVMITNKNSKEGSQRSVFLSIVASVNALACG
ncbi:hypothetical protein DASB73_027490 [Starmerella bacillaris]|uniref:Uncharacterized protein n=1 Tax=Starmerella bacillaris TaxID=1247836 RepID=A0AAV5RKU9_STABA|nr:hypothetical protein DASB73_027490 [Starmerella bacillaris]